MYEAANTKRARRRLPTPLWGKAKMKLDQMHSASQLADLNTPSNRLHKLSGGRKGQYSIRINRQYRICFRWVDADAWGVEITDYH